MPAQSCIVAARPGILLLGLPTCENKLQVGKALDQAKVFRKIPNRVIHMNKKTSLYRRFCLHKSEIPAPQLVALELLNSKKDGADVIYINAAQPVLGASEFL